MLDELRNSLIAAREAGYLTGHLNRFGRYVLTRKRVPEPLESLREFRMPPHGERNSRTLQVAV
jgi:translation initiation factor IF-2